MNDCLKTLSGIAVWCCLCLPAVSRQPDRPPLKALILTGGETMDWRHTAPLLQQTLTDCGRFEVRVTESPVGLTADALAPYDVIVNHCGAPGWGETTARALAEYVQSGKGLVVTRNALHAFPDHAALRQDFSDLTRISWPSGTSAVVGPFRRLELKVTAPGHPVMQGMQNPLRTADRLLSGFSVQPDAEVLATTGTNPVLMTSVRGKGRIFVTTLGFDSASLQERTFLTTFARGTEWAASGNVTLPAELALPEPDANALRVLVITGGHDHEGSFYSLFENCRDLKWAQVSSSDMAFREDLRPKYDVIVFYDFSRNLDEKGRKNLQDFVGSGKGIVALHHAVLNYQNWPWWYEEVVGGRYRLSREGDIPNSTVRLNEEHFITPAGEHPITAPIGSFRITDETYHGLWISPAIKPLITTDNPTSDPVIGWIGPCRDSRVVYLQLGHDHTPFRHPSYRALVHRSILWSAGRLP